MIDDQAEFVFDLPVWLIVDQSVHVRLGLPASLTRVSSDAVYLPVFTDEDLCRRFIEAMGDEGKTAIPVSSARDLERCIVAAQIDAVGFDVDHAQNRLFNYPVGRVLGYIRAKWGL